MYATARNVDKMSSLKHPNVRCRALDVVNDENVVSLVSDIIHEAGRIDVLVNNAGGMCVGSYHASMRTISCRIQSCTPGPTIEIEMRRALEVFDINFFGILRMARTVIPHMAARKSGLVINVGSVVGET